MTCPPVTERSDSPGGRLFGGPGFTSRGREAGCTREVRGLRREASHRLPKPKARQDERCGPPDSDDATEPASVVAMHAHSVALHFMYDNVVKIHQRVRTTPAQAAGVTDRRWETPDIVEWLEARSP